MASLLFIADPSCSYEGGYAAPKPEDITCFQSGVGAWVAVPSVDVFRMLQADGKYPRFRLRGFGTTPDEAIADLRDAKATALVA